MLKFFFIVVAILISLNISSQTDTAKFLNRKGISLGGVPVIAFNTDKGFQYGLAMSVFNFGNGEYYPNYKQSMYLEWSRTTKQSGINQVIFDFKDLFGTKLRMLSEISYITDKLLPFYGFNGYDSYYNSLYENEKKVDEGYISRAYYKIDRSQFRIINDFQGTLKFKKFRWVAGWGYMNFKINTVDVNSINSGLSDKDKLPDVPTLYDEYVEKGIISPKEKNGGEVLFAKLGIVYDTRDNEANPARGSWSELVFLNAPSLVNKNVSYLDFVVVHRHYFTIIKPNLTMANRIGYQGLVSGNKPFYLLPFHFSSYRITEAFGGVKTLRGIMANRIVGNGVLFGNFEFRYKFLTTKLWKQDFYVSGNAFLDWGMVVQKYKIEETQKNELKDPIADREKPHFSSGAGLRFAFNHNFIIAVDYGHAFDKMDGNQAFYVALDFLY